MARHSELKLKRQLGAYYTPLHISSMLAQWSIRSPKDRILEPGFGGCGFLEVSKKCLLDLGCSKPDSNLYGCDKDKNAFDFLAEKIGPTVLDGHFLFRDFLSLSPENFSVQKFDAIIGNPPYVSMHNMPQKQRENAESAAQKNGYVISRRASLWAYFILHALQFLKKNGRCAWVLPSSFINADYAKQVHHYLEQGFSRILISPLTEKLFLSEGAKENTVILLAEGWQEGPASKGIQIVHSTSSEQLLGFIEEWRENTTEFSTLSHNSSVSYLSNEERFCYQRLVELQETKSLNDYVKVRIGIVTGANNFFILDRESAKEKKIEPIALKPIFTKFSHTNGLEITNDILNSNVESNKPCLLLNTEGDSAKLKGVSRYLDSFSPEDRDKVKTFKKRAIWHKPDDSLVPDAFFSYMSDSGPRIVLNVARTTSTNSIHRIYYKNNMSKLDEKLLAISLLSSFSQLSSEIVGRSYGSGVLKLEPSGAKNIKIMCPTSLSRYKIESTFRSINTFLINGDKEAARREADLLILPAVLPDTYKDTLTILENALHALRKLRRM